MPRSLLNTASTSRVAHTGAFLVHSCCRQSIDAASFCQLSQASEKLFVASRRAFSSSNTSPSGAPSPAEVTEAPSEGGEGVRRCPRPSSSCGSSELRVDGDGNRARAGDVRDSEDLDVDREHGSWEKISRNATRAQHPPPRGGARLPIEAHVSSAIFSIVHLLLVLLAGRVHDEERVEVPFRRCPKGGNPAFLDDQSQNWTTRK